MRLLLILLPFLVSSMSVFGAEREPPPTRCESRLEAPAMALVRIVEMAVERKLVDPARIQQAFADGRFTNPFAPAPQAQYRRAFAAWEGQLSDTQKQIFRDRIAIFLAKIAEDAKRSDRAKTETAVVFNPKVIDKAGATGIGEHSMTWLDGRPIFFAYIQNPGPLRLVIFDPFAPDSEARLRHLPPMSVAGSVIHPAPFHWQGHDYLILPKEKKIFDLRTLVDVSEDFAAERLGRENHFALKTVVVNRTDGPYAISSIYISDGIHQAQYGLLGVALAHPQQANERLFGDDIGSERIKWLRKFNLGGREIVAVHLERKIIVWDGKSGQRFPDIDSYDLMPDATFLIFDGRMACAYWIIDPQGNHGIRIVDVENGDELKLIRQLTSGPINILEHRGKQWLVVREPSGYVGVNLEDDSRREISGGGHAFGVFKWKGDDYILGLQMSPHSLSVANLFESRALFHPMEKHILKLKQFNYQDVPYALVEFKGDRTASIVKLFNPL